MSRPHVPADLRRRVADQSRHRCGYCLTPEAIAGMTMQLDHILPASHGGETVEDNLWLACSACNDHKHDRVTGPDPETGANVRLFDPRRQTWADHFAWSDDGVNVVGRTPTGRATVLALHLNRSVLVTARRLWVGAGWHPPRD
jgi:5-methylcytosine-specific restriction endonuclease McrA